MTPLTASDRRIIRVHLEHIRGLQGARPSTIDHRRANLLRLASALNRPLLDATTDDLIGWQDGLTRRRSPRGDLISSNTIATYCSHVRAFYKWAFGAGHLDADPAVRLPRVRCHQGPPRPIPERDLQDALICADRDMRMWLILAAFMGLRCMEIAQLRRDNVSEEDGLLVLSAVGKGGKAFRMVVPHYVEVELRGFLTTDHLLWRTAAGEAISPSYLSKMVSNFFGRIGMRYTLHWARHSFGTAAYAHTKDLLLTQDLMRHASPETTRRYVSTGGRAGVRAMDQLAARALRRRAPRPSSPEEAA